MAKLTSYERFKRMYEHREADRVPIQDSPWGTTIERWQREGMPKDANWVDFFDTDHLGHIGADNSPRYPAKVLEENDEYKLYTTSWGATLKSWKHITSTPEFVDFTIKDRDTWEAAKQRMTPSRDRVNWDYLKQNYPIWREKGYWVETGIWFGFDVAHSWAIGTERVLMALIEDPEWCMDIFNHYLDVDLALRDMIWDAGYRFDCVNWPDDMGFKGKQFFSLNTYRNVLKPVHKRAVDWAHAKGCKVRLHSCGNIMPLVPELIDIGIDCLNPLEVKAGMDPTGLKKTYGKKLAFHGGINAVLWDDRPAIEAEMKRVLPVMKQGGGYIFASDHSIPSSVSLEDFRGIVDLAKKLGSYE
jgi:uroporphyrinogen decarboxylase